MKKDTRRSHRVDLEVDVSFESEHNFYTGFGENISSGGLFVATHALRIVGSTLRIKFHLPNVADPIEADGVVRWVREVGEVGMGVQFVQLSEPVQQAINAFISRRDSIFFDHDS